MQGREGIDKFIITEVRTLTESTFILRFTRGNMFFRAGQHIIVGISGEMDQREYSIYSGENDEEVEILVREVKEGNISVKLRNCKPGDRLDVNGPFGSFGIEPYNLRSGKHIFIATGTGISPFHSIIRSYPAIDYMLIHGVSFRMEAYESHEYPGNRYILCTSKEKSGDFNGRVTVYMKDFTVKDNMLFYLCGNGNMIYEVYNILREKGIHPKNIKSERYF